MEELRGMALASSVTDQAPEAPMLKEQVVEDVLARLRRGTAVLALAREYGVDPKTIRAWRDRGGYRPRERRPYPSALAPYADWLRARAPEVEYNAAVLHRELVAQGFTGSPVIVRRFVQPLRAAATRAGDAEMISLWAGQGVRLAARGSAEAMLRRWWDEAGDAARALSRRTGI